MKPDSPLSQPSAGLTPTLRRVYWETTAACNLRCIHCRRVDVLDRVSEEELSTDQARAFIDDLASTGRPVLILSGGEPLFRKDIFEVASYASQKGLPVALSTNGTLVNEEIARKMKESGVYYASVSLDGARAETHDLFRGKGAFSKTVAAVARMREKGIKVQVNFTVTRMNVGEVPEVHELTRLLGAQALYLFLLVPVGCGVQIAPSQMLSSEEVEEWLEWVYKKQKSDPLEVRAICAPQYYRVKEELSIADGSAASAPSRRLGCLAGIDICFVSHKGDVFPCGYLPTSAGNVKSEPLSAIWKSSELLGGLRDETRLEGKCGGCAYKTLCGGCRARAYFATGNVQSEEPYCAHEPLAVQ